MKASRIYTYNKTKGERRHEHEIVLLKNVGVKHPGSKTAKMLHSTVKNNL